MKKTSSLSKDTRNLTRKILSENEVRLISRRLRKAMGSVFEGLPSVYGRDIEDFVRFQAVATRFRETRESRGMKLKVMAEILRVPQYRLQHIEKGDVKNLDPCLLQRYIVCLVQEKWFARWRRANRKLAARLALKSRPEDK
jgi:hypothetical protein